MTRLRGLGWVETTLTAAGLEALRLGGIEAEHESGRSLGNYNASMQPQRGNPVVAERHLQRSQAFLDLANELQRRS